MRWQRSCACNRSATARSSRARTSRSSNRHGGQAHFRRAFLEHLVVFFHDQPLTPAQFMAFARRMGKPIEYPLVKGIAGFPEVIEVKKLEHERQNFGGLWHSDTAYLENPPMGSMLLAREVPPYGGDTEFANQYGAYETLSEGMRNCSTAWWPST